MQIHPVIQEQIIKQSIIYLYIFSGVAFSKFTPLIYLLQNGFTLELLDENQVKQSNSIKPTAIMEAEVEDVQSKIKVDSMCTLELYLNKC